MKARVRNGRLVLDEPTNLPDGKEVDLVPADSWDDLDEAERRRLHEALRRSETDRQTGRVRPAGEFLDSLSRPDN